MAALSIPDIKDDGNGSDNDGYDSESRAPGPLSPHWKDYLKDKIVLFYCESMRGVASELAQKSNGTIVLGKIEWGLFHDGFPNLKVRNAYNLRWAHVAFLADLSNPRNIFEQYSIMCALPRYLAKSVKIFVGYFPTGTYIHYISFTFTSSFILLSRD